MTLWLLVTPSISVTLGVTRSSSIGAWGDNGNWNKFKPPHHWHDCGSYEKDWDKVEKWKDDDSDGWSNGWGHNDGGWHFPDYNRPRSVMSVMVLVH